MLFKSRYKESFLNKINKYFWPKRGWTRAGKYLSLRIVRLPGTPHAIALGFAIGAAVAMTPLYGIHFLLGILFAWVFGGSIIASLIGNLLANPWTYPVICLISFKIGSIFISNSSTDLVTIASITNELSHIGKIFTSIVIDGNLIEAWKSFIGLDFIPLILIGSIPVSIAVGIVSYFLSRRLISKYQSTRKKKIEGKSGKNNE